MAGLSLHSFLALRGGKIPYKLSPFVFYPPQVISKDGITSNILPEYVMAFQPPLVVHNVLPYSISVVLADSQAEQSVFTIGVGGFVEVYQFDMSRKIRMSIDTQVSTFHFLRILRCKSARLCHVWLLPLMVGWTLHMQRNESLPMADVSQLGVHCKDR